MLGFQLVRVKEQSMYPSLKEGDLLLLNKFSNTESIAKIKRLDIIIFKDPISGKPFIKRVIGLPSEKVKISNKGEIFVNGKSIKSLNTEIEEFEWILRDREFLVLGDNLRISYDSRKLGPIRSELIIGKVVKKIWPIF